MAERKREKKPGMQLLSFARAIPEELHDTPSQPESDSSQIANGMPRWFETILPHRLITLITGYFEPEEQYMYSVACDTLGPYIQNIPSDIINWFSRNCAQKGLLNVLTWGIQRAELIWNQHAATIVSIEAAEHNQPEIVSFASELCDREDGAIFWAAVSSGSTALVQYLYENGYSNRHLTVDRVEAMRASLDHGTEMIDFLRSRVSIERTTYDLDVACAVAAHNSPSIWQHFKQNWERKEINTWRVAIDSGNLGFLKYYATCTPQKWALVELQHYARTAQIQNPEILKWLNEQPRVQMNCNTMRGPHRYKSRNIEVAERAAARPDGLGNYDCARY